MKTIPLTKGFRALIDDEDLWRCLQYQWHYHQGYGRGRVNTKEILLHRFIIGVYDSKVQVDHEDRNGLNCQKYNLRTATNKQNSANKKGLNEYKGVYLYKGKWRVICCKKHIGLFTDPIEAAKAYDKEAKKRYGNFAYLNFPLVGATNGELADGLERGIRTDNEREAINSFEASTPEG